MAATPTGIVLICSKLLPCAFAISLSACTLVYGEHDKKKAEHLAAATSPSAGASPSTSPSTSRASPGH